MTTVNEPHRTRHAPAEAIAFVSGNTRQLGNLPRVLRRAVGHIEFLDSLRGISDYSAFGLVAVHYDTLTPAEQAELTQDFVHRIQRPTLLLLSDGCAQQDFARLFGSHALTNMLVINDSGVDVADLLVTVQKIRRGDIFGLEKYFVWGVEPRIVRVTASTEKNQALEVLTAYAESIGIATRFRSLIRTVADEFLTNAIYNAPIDCNGKPRFAHCARTVPVHLDPGEEIELRYCCDGRRFGISTSDPFGSLAPAQVQDYLAKGFRRGTDQMREDGGGAGLGFFQILDSLSHLVIDVDPGKQTEMIGLMDVSGDFRTFAGSGKSFNIFVQGGSK